MAQICECTDPGCPKHKGKSKCTSKAVDRLFRIDMEDKSGTWFCRECLLDAIDAGVFRDAS